MLEENNREPEFLAIVMAITIAMFGGVARELSHFDTCFNVKKFISNIVVSGFAGCLVGLAAPEFEHKNIVMIVAGISGTMGISIVNYCGEILKAVLKQLASNALGSKLDINDSETEDKNNQI